MGGRKGKIDQYGFFCNRSGQIIVSKVNNSVFIHCQRILLDKDVASLVHGQL